MLKYHDPRYSNFLYNININPEIYATPWFLTFFAAKLPIDLLYTFWDNYILTNEKFFIFFVALAYLMHFKTDILSKEPETVPIAL